jgi:hypothetical protein
MYARLLLACAAAQVTQTFILVSLVHHLPHLIHGHDAGNPKTTVASSSKKSSGARL